MEKKSESFGKDLPEKRFNAGAISVTIWRNEGKLKDGTKTEFATISLNRSYKDSKGNWKNTSHLRSNDLPKAAMALNKAYEYLSFKQETEVVY